MLQGFDPSSPSHILVLDRSSHHAMLPLYALPSIGIAGRPRNLHYLSQVHHASFLLHLQLQSILPLDCSRHT